MISDRLDEIYKLIERRGINRDHVAAVAEVGSTVHGIGVNKQDDLDLTAIRIEPFYELVAGDTKRQSMMIRTKPEGVRSEPGDIDIQCYTLRKFSQLAAGGNPSILTALHSPVCDKPPKLDFIDFNMLADRVRSKRAGAAFLGYMQQQKERWRGDRGQKNVTRPELVEQYGFDTKYAGHIIRLGLQGVEYMTTGRLTLPLPQETAEAIRNLRTGGYSEAEALEWSDGVERQLKMAIELSSLPDVPNMAGVVAFLTISYRQAYKFLGMAYTS